MKVALLGTKSLGAAAVRQIANGEHKLVVAVGDEKVQQACDERGVPCWTMGNPKQSLGGAVNPWRPDVIVAVHWTRYLRTEQLDAPIVGIHPSLLPRWRGINAVNWTIRAGDSIAGSTAYWMDSGLDTGPVIAQRWGFVDPAWNASGLWRHLLFGLSLDVLQDALESIRTGQAWLATPQDERFATLAPAYEESDGVVRIEGVDYVVDHKTKATK